MRARVAVGSVVGVLLAAAGARVYKARAYQAAVDRAGQAWQRQLEALTREQSSEPLQLRLYARAVAAAATGRRHVRLDVGRSCAELADALGKIDAPIACMPLGHLELCTDIDDVTWSAVEAYTERVRDCGVELGQLGATVDVPELLGKQRPPWPTPFRVPSALSAGTHDSVLPRWVATVDGVAAFARRPAQQQVFAVGWNARVRDVEPEAAESPRPPQWLVRARVQLERAAPATAQARLSDQSDPKTVRFKDGSTLWVVRTPGQLIAVREDDSGRHARAVVDGHDYGLHHVQLLQAAPSFAAVVWVQKSGIYMVMTRDGGRTWLGKSSRVL